ncbi:PREDICTED: dynein beta chain, ciliary-like [Polistes dominula]|uniref:Dynein beta chain, ciliary-like n=1 Tax=Polistes dominula TaxID=743375 RepID=A0ABM1J500_POLDO|nr:PREDICTED: dynein beta chain, ciliary-like [Polistes dominula]
MSGKKDDLKKQEEEELFDFLYKYLVLSRKIKYEAWMKLLGSEDLKTLILKFFNIPSEMMLTIQLLPTGAIIPSLGIQLSSRVKSSYFIKREPVKITKDNYRKMIILGDMAPKPIEEAATLIEEVYLPILTNPANQTGWPLVAKEDVKKHIYDLRSLFHQIKGKMFGETILAIPIDIEQIFEEGWKQQERDDSQFNVKLRSNIESIINKWTSQINEILHDEKIFLSSDYLLPNDELEFWSKRMKNLESIYQQINDPRVKRIGSILELIESPYYNYFNNICENVISAIVEARDIWVHLKPLQYYFDKIQSTEFNDIQPLLKPLMHCVCLLWSHSKYYCTTTRIIRLLSMISNLLIAEADKYLDQSSLFEGDVEDNLKRLGQTKMIMIYYQDLFLIFRDKIENYFKPPNEPVLWNFDDKLIFSRVRKFDQRLNELQDFFEIVQEYLKLERVEIAGLKGNLLYSMISEIYENFVKMYRQFADVHYNVLIPEDMGFNNDWSKFKANIEIMDRKLVNIFNEAFMECYDVESMFRFIWIIGTIANRPILMEQLWHNYNRLVEIINDEYDNIKIITDNYFNITTESENNIANKNLHSVSESLSFLNNLKQQINYPIECAALVDHPLIMSKINFDIREKYNELKVLIDNLEQLNFDPELTAVIQEIRDIVIMKKSDVPEEAIELYNRSTFFFETTCNLNLILNWYNWLQKNTSPVEYQLVKDEVEEIEKLIEFGQLNYNWNSIEVPEYVEQLLNVTRKLYIRIFKVQENINGLLKMIYSWALVPVLERKDLKEDNLLAIGEREEHFAKRYEEIELVVKELNRVLKENYNLLFDLMPESTYEENETDFFNADEQEDRAENLPIEELPETRRMNADETTDLTEEEELIDGMEVEQSEIELGIELTEEEAALQAELEAQRFIRWKPYLSYIDNLIYEGLVQTVSTSLCYILDETDPECTAWPLFEIQLSLDNSNLIFQPSIDIDDPNGFYAFYEDLLLDIMKMSTLIKRVDPDIAEERQHYGIDMTEEENITFMLEETSNRIKLGLFQAEEYLQTFKPLSWLWLDDKKEYLDLFLRFGRKLSKQEKDIVSRSPNNLPDTLKERTPKLEDYKREIDFFMDLYKECDKINDECVLLCWLRIDLKPFKQNLLNLICKWANVLKNHLMDGVTDDLKNLSIFLNKASNKFAQPVKEDDYEDLLKTIYFLKEVRDRQFEIDDMFEPIKETIELLKEYQVQFGEETFDWLVELPELWTMVKKQAAQIKQVVGPLMSHQINLLNKRLNYYDFREKKFLSDFYTNEVFNFDCTNVYEKLDNINVEINKFEDELNNLKVTANIFEYHVEEFKHIVQARRELKLVKMLWDYINIIRTSLDEWKKTIWKKIDVEGTDIECKKFIRELRQMDKDTRNWNLYIQIEGQVKNMMSSLRAVSELKNTAIRDRHWLQLMAETQVRFTMDDKTTLEDLIKLELHKYEEEVKEIVDKAVKEMAMEKILKELNNTWATLEFDKDLHERTKLYVLRIEEETIDILEENQVQLQNMLGSKYVAYFLDEVLDWQLKLNNADAVITAWFDVQRAWMNLESIFIGSEDIRNQLPEESKLFEKIDKDFKDLLKEMLSTLNIVRATNKPKLLERLEQLEKDLNICENALFHYLETKRLAYPRFYFVSSADLLDILSNSSNPELVCKHLAKLYDSIASLKWKIEQGKTTKMANVMIAKDGEEMPIHGDCDCSGKVEIWLNHVTDAMKRSVRYHIQQAVISYDEKPREQWIMDYKAQPSLCGTQIWWTTEVNMAFARLEEGFEHALRDYLKKQINQLQVLITILCGELNESDRQKIMTICTIDVHARDVVAKLISMKADNASNFQWQSQLRHRWDDSKEDCYANICDACFLYAYEYLGNVPRLVITPLTDRCYITLTQSLHLIMGGAPAGPAGTGKTETTKDLGRALGQMVYVFNCSEQMDYKSCGNIYKGLSQTGAWGCFDEFNRISIEVLSVVAVQVKCVLDAIKAKKTKFLFFGEELVLVNSVGMFITMNPGYAGRTELPENIKSLFRPCAMVVPDFELICEIMLVAEGFLDARLLARKFITLYTLCRELLSKQDHYDWGLRAIKSVLVVAGKLKRDDRLRPEDQVLMRALRDFNTPKVITDDIPVFMGLISDLFPALDVPRLRDTDFEQIIRGAAVDLKMQPEDGFILKVVQLEELFNVRHSVFIVGLAGTGKTQVWKTLYKTYHNQKLKPYYNDLSPKAVTTDELFGTINPSTREWKDGLISMIMREQANMSGDGPKWIVFDGDIDPMWIESLNTVMDDNKVLTLASNERIALTKHMRLLFEVSHLRTATPATVSRAGILYINPQDLGWNPYVMSWTDTRDSSERANLAILFDKYVPISLETLKLKFKKVTPIPDICHLQMLCNLLDCFLVKENVPPECPREWYELYFAFACIWAFGSSMFEDQLKDWREEFSKWWQNEFKAVTFPSTGTVFHYFIDTETKRWLPWESKVTSFELDMDIPIQASLVSTGETVRLRFFMDILMKKKLPVMLVGSAGSGKSIIVAEKLATLPDNYNMANVSLNYYTTSEMLQRILEKHLEKKAGRNYGPPGTKLLVYFIDDMNMPEIDTYGTVQSHSLIRQYMDYGHWYDREKLTLKDIHNTQYVSCMNPTVGSFTIDPRLQRHFAVFAVSFPHRDALETIYSQMLEQHLTNPQNKINVAVQKMTEPIINAALSLHTKVATTFLPTAIKFHYIFNLRDLSNIFQGILFSTGDTIPMPNYLVRLFVHESMRVYSDKLINFEDKNTFEQLLLEVLRQNIPEFNDKIVLAKPIIYCHFAEGIGESKYMPIRDWNHLIKLLDDALLSYNELISAMNLVLFDDAMYHVCRINRILESQRGNGLLVGVGGSGKQSLSRLSAFISALEVFQIQLTKDYSLIDLKSDLAALYLKAGLKSIGIAFLMTDSQIAQEKFLVVINDMLASGEILELFPDDEMDNIINAVRNEVRQTGQVDSKENCWKFFIDRVRKFLKCLLCFSPVGATLRNRVRQFPAIVNCTSINWFQDWPQEALQSVSARFLQELNELPQEYKRSASLFMSFVHTIVNETSKLYLQNEKRYNYTTPKSFLEQISLYSKLLREKTFEVQNMITRLQNGLEKLDSCAEEVDKLKAVLAVQEIDLIKKNEIADQILQEVQAENTKAEVEKAFVSEEEVKVAEIKETVAERQRYCDEDLAKAEPAVKQAEAALDTLNKSNLTELKSFGAPPEAVTKVAQAVLVLFAPRGQIPKDRSWKACKAMMGSVDAFLTALHNYDKENIHPEIVRAIQPYITDREFEPELIYSKSQAAAGLCSWVKNIMVFHYINETVKPLRAALAQANAELKAAMDRLHYLRSRLNELQKVLDVLSEKMEIALAEKQKCQDEADATALTIDLANRLVNGLASEKIRWTETLEMLKRSGITVPGDVLLVTAFISYMGGFTRKYRLDLLNIHWLPYFDKLEISIPRTPDLDLLSLITDDTQIAQWNNEGLPADKMSAENATILTNSSRWPLMIDPQLQGIKWIKNKYGDELKVLRLSQRNYLDVIEFAISNGQVVLLENIMETVDAVLDPVLARVLIRKGRALKIGDKEVDYDPNFRLILQTKLANPHYKPEMQAQTTIINFTVTRDGLEEQLLGEVVKAERPDLESTKSELTTQQNTFKITLKALEDDLLHRLSSAGPDILSDITLVVNLETTKRTAAEIEIKAAEAKETAIKIDMARELYRPVAARASLLYFILNELYKINMLYQFSLKAFSIVFENAIKFAELADSVEKRVSYLIQSITYLVYVYTSRGLFESDKIIFLFQMTIQILLHMKEISLVEVDFILRFPYVPYLRSRVDFLDNKNWGGIVYLSGMDAFQHLDRDMEGASKRWKKIVESETPEKERFPQEWKNVTALQRLCMIRCMRLDRMTYAVRLFVEEKLGPKFVQFRALPFEKSYEETSSITPVFFILSPGVDPLKDVENLGQKLGFTMDGQNFHNVSLGQGQEPIAEKAMNIAAAEGHWVILQNIHLVQSWLPKLERKIEQLTENPHDNYRLYMSAEPAPDPSQSIIPQGILESAIKITNEPPTGMHANIHKALDNFSQETLDSCTKETEFKAILFALCYYHAVINERRKFGAQGWNKSYPFSVGDLTISVSVLLNYLENNVKVPWEDLRYLFGEIMYGGHITDDWDRRLCKTYLIEYLQPELIEGELYLTPGFLVPPNSDYMAYHQYIDDYLPAESPILYGLHPNAEIGFLTATAENLFRTLIEMQPRDVIETTEGGFSMEDKVKYTIEDLLDRLPEEFNIPELMDRVEEPTPYVIVSFQECERMNILCNELKRSLGELTLGLKGELTISSDMEVLQDHIFINSVPPLWNRLAYPSNLSLSSWFTDMLNRVGELASWTSDFNLPSSVWLGGFFNPQSFLTAIMQQTARKNEWPLDKMCLHCEVTTKQKEEVTAPPREGSYINSLYMEGARWDIETGVITDARLKELFPLMPVVYIRAITQDKQDLKNMYECPVYKTRSRGPTYVWTFNLRTRDKANKWILAGVAIVLQI